MAKRVLLAGLFHETHTFLEGRTTLEDFQVRRGKELLIADDGSPLAGVCQVARAAGWELLPAIDLRASPSATVDDAVVDCFWESFRAAADASAGRIEGVFLVLHGAMASQSLPDVEGELLERIDRLLGALRIPVCGVLDLHANYSARMARYSHGLIAYRENPHTDAQAAAIEAAWLLDRLMASGERPATVWQSAPVIWPPTGLCTASNPMRSLEAQAREIERAARGIVAVNVLAGYAFADTLDTGVSFSAITLGDPEEARRQLKRLAQWTVEHREAGNLTDLPIEEAMPSVLAEPQGPVLVVEPADNIGGGAPGDGTGVLRALVEHRVENAAVVLNDPAAVAALHGKRPGHWARLAIGGKGSRLDPGPLELELELVSSSDGRFDLEDRQSHLASMCGVRIEMGRCVVARHGGIRILLTSRKTPPFDLGQLRSQGIEPESLRVIGVKAAVAHRRAYDPIAKASYTVDTPGPCSSNLQRFPYRRVRRPVYPLDQLPDPRP